MSSGAPPRLARWWVLSLVLIVTMAAPGGGMHATSFGEGTQIDADTVLLDVSIQPDGDAAWEIRYRVRLDDENTTAAFESLEEDVRANRSAFADRFESRIQGTVSAAENATGREMGVENVSVRTERQEIPQSYGLLIYSFEWTGFAVTDGRTIRAGDAIGGLYLDDSTSLTISWSADYVEETVDPAPDDRGDRSVTWRGPAEFTTEQPRLAVTVASSTTQTPNEPTTGTEDVAAAGPSTPLLAAAVVVLIGLVGLVWWWRRRREGDHVPGTTSDTESSPPPEELLSNEERVLRLLREHGGRMKQQQVVEELGWTDAKTSQVVGDLRESGEIEGFRLGRENVLSLPDDDVDESG